MAHDTQKKIIKYLEKNEKITLDDVVVLTTGIREAYDAICELVRELVLIYDDDGVFLRSDEGLERYRSNNGIAIDVCRDNEDVLDKMCHYTIQQIQLLFQAVLDSEGIPLKEFNRNGMSLAKVKATLDEFVELGVMEKKGIAYRCLLRPIDLLKIKHRILR